MWLIIYIYIFFNRFSSFWELYHLFGRIGDTRGWLFFMVLRTFANWNPSPSNQGLESAGNQITSHTVNKYGPKGFDFAMRSDIYQQKQTDGPQKSLLASRLTYQQHDVYEMETLSGLTSTETLVLGRPWFCRNNTGSMTREAAQSYLWCKIAERAAFLLTISTFWKPQRSV